LISCRNLLIYFEVPSQQQVLAAFHYALKPKGVLFLGASESPDVQRDLFEAADGRSHIYLRREHPIVFQYQGHRRGDRSAVLDEEATPVVRGSPPAEKSPLSRKLAIERTRDIVAEHYSPPAIIIDGDDRIVHFVGDLSPFVTLPRGPTQRTAHQLVIAPLNAEMRALLHRCRKEHATVRGGSYTLELKGQVTRVTLVAHPDIKDKSTLVMLAFETRPLVEDQDSGRSESVGLIRELERELAGTREHLQTLVEEVETSNEELQTLNEELQSSNEELQSTNEEMQTSNEELQSTNEELLTVNEELANKTSELETSRADLENIKDALETAIIAVNETLSVTQFNRAAARLTVTGALRAGALFRPWSGTFRPVESLRTF
jgi:two-component system CheB/CheR fusion protein